MVKCNWLNIECRVADMGLADMGLTLSSGICTNCLLSMLVKKET